MKFTINRRLYDTESSEKLVEVQKSYGKYGEDPEQDWTETLYRKNNGEYFMLGRGGKNSPFSEFTGGKNQAGNMINIWKEDNLNGAKLWVHDNAPEMFDKLFNPKDDNELSTTTITLSVKAKRNLKRYSKETKMTVSEIIRRYAEGLYE